MYTNLSDFIQHTIGPLRWNNTAQFIVSADNDSMTMLTGFVTESNKSDFTICEEAYEHYKQLQTILNK